MPKMKTNRGAAKRFSATGGGRIRRSKAYSSHILTKKSTKRKRTMPMSAPYAGCCRICKHPAATLFSTFTGRPASGDPVTLYQQYERSTSCLV